MSTNHSPLGALARGAAAGAVGTAAMTVYQTLRSVRKGTPVREAVAPGPPAEWDDAPAPGQVGYRFVRGLFQKDVPASRATTMTNVVHWLYGTAWGGLYGLAEGTAELNPLLAGTGFGSVVSRTRTPRFRQWASTSRPGSTTRRRSVSTGRITSCTG